MELCGDLSAYFTVDEGIRALEDVIYHLETYDITTIRASTPMYLLSRKVKSLGIKIFLHIKKYLLLHT